MQENYTGSNQSDLKPTKILDQELITCIEIKGHASTYLH